MRLTFRQGIARFQTDIYGTSTFLQKSGNYINLVVSPDPTVIVFAHKGSTYVVEEKKTVSNAWGPFTGSTTQYLYWDVSLLDASLTRGFTAFPPVVAGVAPAEPAADQHWFDTINHQMKVWNGTKWLEKLRVFAGTYSSSAVLQPQGLGTQAGENGNFEGGNIVLDSFDKPIRQFDGTFVTSATSLTTLNASPNRVKLESELIIGMASENIPKFSFVQVDKGQTFKLARSSDWRSRIHGIVVEDLYESEIGRIEPYGLVRYDQWNWSDEVIGKTVFCGPTGEVTVDVPTAGALQPAGYVLDRDAIFVDIKNATILTDITSETIGGSTQPHGQAPVAAFSANPSVGTAPLTVSFKSTSLNGPTGWDWDFTNDGVVDSNSETATFTYMTPGTYDVSLKVRSPYGENVLVKSGAVVVQQATPVDDNQTNLAIQLNGPLQVSKGDTASINVVAINSGYLQATRVARTVYIDDVGGYQVSVSNTPAGTTVARGTNTTIVTLPVISYFASGQSVTSAFTITAPSTTGAISFRAGVVSPETDSSLDNNAATLTVRIK